MMLEFSLQFYSQINVENVVLLFYITCCIGSTVVSRLYSKKQTISIGMK